MEINSDRRQTHRLIMFAGLLAIVSLLVVPAELVAQDVPKLTAQGRAEISKGNYDRALKTFESASKLDPSDAEAMTLQFYNAVALQQKARGAKGADKTRLLEASASMYQTYLYSREDFAATNNLAKIYEQLGWPKQAVALYEEAIAADSPKRAAYLQNYASLLDRLDQPKSADAIYSRFLRTQPLSDKQYMSIAERYEKRGFASLLQYLWELVDVGAYRAAAAIATTKVIDANEPSDDARIESLAIVAFAVSQLPFEQKEGSIVQLVGAGGDRVSVAGGIRQVRLLHSIARRGMDASQNQGVNNDEPLAELSEYLVPQRYPWWQERSRADMDPVRGVWPADSFRALIRSYGSDLKQLAGSMPNEEPRAGTYYQFSESFFRLAAELQSWEIDPLAVREIVRIKVENDELDSIEDVLQRYQIRLFEGKGGAIRNNHVRKAFEYHKTLGELYTQLNVFGHSGSVQSAVFQLEKAREASHTIESYADGELPSRYEFSPEMVEMLDTAYQATGRPDAATRLRIDEAERYKVRGNDKAAEIVLAPLNHRTISSPVLRRRYDDLLTAEPGDQLSDGGRAPIVNRSNLMGLGNDQIQINLPNGESTISEGQADQIARQIQRIIDSGAIRYDREAWEDAPGNLESLQLKNDGRGEAVLSVDGEVVQIPFEKLQSK